MDSDLKTVYDSITAKRATYNALDGYYHGDQPTVYLTQRMREIFRPLDIAFTENWCSVVVDACNERINLTGFEATDARAEDVLAAAWDRNQIATEASDIHTDALVLGECYAIVWPDEDGLAEVYYNDARMIHCMYSEASPRKMSLAGKLWRGDDGRAKITLYYPDRIEYYTSERKFESVSSAEAFSPDLSAFPTGQAPNPYGQIPVFHFRINRASISDLKNVLPLQNGINKLLADMLVAAEYGAYNQRWVISQGDTSGLKNAPGEVWDLPAGDGIGQGTQVGQFQSTDLKNYLDAIDRLSMAIGVLTRTPKHYFFSQSGDPSGEALIALEAPLNKKAQDRIDRFRTVWRDIALFICKIEGVALQSTEVTPQFERPETVQPKTQADIIKTSVDSGMPLDTALTRAGWTESEIEAMNKVKDEGASKAQAGLAASLLKAQQDMKMAPMPGQQELPGQESPGATDPGSGPVSGQQAQGAGKNKQGQNNQFLNGGRKNAVS